MGCPKGLQSRQAQAANSRTFYIKQEKVRLKPEILAYTNFLKYFDAIYIRLQTFFAARNPISCRDDIINNLYNNALIINQTQGAYI